MLLLAQFKSPIILILISAVVLSFFLIVAMYGRKKHILSVVQADQAMIGLMWIFMSQL